MKQWMTVLIFDENGAAPQGLTLTDSDGNTWALRADGVFTAGNVPPNILEELVRQLKLINIIET